MQTANPDQRPVNNDVRTLLTNQSPADTPKAGPDANIQENKGRQLTLMQQKAKANQKSAAAKTKKKKNKTRTGPYQAGKLQNTKMMKKKATCLPASLTMRRPVVGCLADQQQQNGYRNMILCDARLLHFRQIVSIFRRLIRASFWYFALASIATIRVFRQICFAQFEPHYFIFFNALQIRGLCGVARLSSCQGQGGQWTKPNNELFLKIWCFFR